MNVFAILVESQNYIGRFLRIILFESDPEAGQLFVSDVL